MSGLSFDYMVFNLLGIEDRTIRYFVELAQRKGLKPHVVARDLLDMTVEKILTTDSSHESSGNTPRSG